MGRWGCFSSYSLRFDVIRGKNGLTNNKHNYNMQHNTVVKAQYV